MRQTGVEMALGSRALGMAGRIVLRRLDVPPTFCFILSPSRRLSRYPGAYTQLWE